MDPLTIGLIYGVSVLIRTALKNAEQQSKTSSPNLSPAPPKTNPPGKKITFVGNTGVGKSSTINALVGYEALKEGTEHGTTTKIADINYISGYKLQDTPGLMDTIDFSNIVWGAIKDSELVIYTTNGQLYQQELNLVSRISSQQKTWDMESSCSNCRKLALYVNKQDIKKYSMDRKTREKEAELITEQVKLWISAEKIVFGASSPVFQGIKQATQVEELKKLIFTHIV